jgi:hypothetical protein
MRIKYTKKIDCACGGSYTYNSKYKHFKSKIHLQFLEVKNLKEEIEQLKLKK